MGLLTFAVNVTLDGCVDHRVGVADDALHAWFTELLHASGAILFGRATYELMEGHWPAVARDAHAPPADRAWAIALEEKPKHVVSSTRAEFPWANTHRVEGDLRAAVERLKRQTPDGVLVGSPRLGAALERWGLIDEYRVVVHPVLAGHGPTLFAGLERARRLALVGSRTFGSGVVAMHLRRMDGSGAASDPAERTPR